LKEVYVWIPKATRSFANSRGSLGGLVMTTDAEIEEMKRRILNYELVN